MVTVSLGNLPIAIVVNLLSLVNPLIMVLKEKHYTLRNVAVINGLGMIATGISLLIFNPSLYLYRIPLAVFPIVIGFLVVAVTSNRIELWKYLGNSLVTLIILILVLLLQFGILAF